MITKEEQDLYDSYADWMKSKGSKFDKVSLKYFHTDYRGVVANETINKNEVIMYVPDQAMITLKMAKEAPIGQQLAKNEAGLIYPSNSTLSTCVLWEIANPSTTWRLFFDALPKSVSTFPVFYTPEEMKLLTGSSFAKSVEELKVDMKYDYDEICRCAPEFAKVASLDDFMRIRMLVNSRIFGTEINGEENDAIVPYADMFNYKYKSEMTSWLYCNERKGFVVKAKEKINKGDEIFVSYGNKPNYNFLQFYGFVLENNEFDEIVFEVGLLESDPIKGLKQSLLGKMKLPRKVRLKETTADTKFIKALSFLRFVTYTGTNEQLKDVR